MNLIHAFVLLAIDEQKRCDEAERNRKIDEIAADILLDTCYENMLNK
jgi:hypothetical protein